MDKILYVFKIQRYRRIELQVCKCKKFEKTNLIKFEKSIFDFDLNLYWKLIVQFQKVGEHFSNVGLYFDCSKNFESGYL